MTAPHDENDEPPNPALPAQVDSAETKATDPPNLIAEPNQTKAVFIEPDEDSGMEIHKPHAAKSWREFFIEIGTIVVGILIALGLEQGVDALHKRNERLEATENIYDEFKQAMGLIHNRDLSKKCIDTRLNQLQQTLTDLKSGKSLAGPTWVGKPPRWIMPVTRWEFTASSGRLSLLPTKDQENFADLHRRVIEINDSLLQEQTDWAQLRIFEVDPNITPQQIATVSAALQDARYRTKQIAFAMDRADEISKLININASATSTDGVKSICLKFPTPTTDAAKLLEK